MGLLDDQKSLLIFDLFKGQKTPRVLNIIKDNNAVTTYCIPSNLTFKRIPASRPYCKWSCKIVFYKLVCKWDQETAGKGDRCLFDQHQSQPECNETLAGAVGDCGKKRDTIIKGFDMAGITEAITLELEDEDPFIDLD